MKTSPPRRRRFSLSRPGPARLPGHVAIIMDGNGRWARRRGLPRVAGHRAGMEAVRRVVRHCATAGVRALTLYAFSADNWKRPVTETGFLMRLLARFLRREVAELDRNRVRLSVIGRTGELPAFARRELKQAVAATRDNDGMVLTLALNYSARQEILDGARRMAAAARNGGAPRHREDFRRFLYTRHLPDPDLVIRTSGEMRLSDFLLWQGAYAELWFTPVLWPDFGARDLKRAFGAYAQRQRRFGALEAAA